eukprot:COSAG02_NODE_68341_length_250_cov_268.940397_1_plen_65_part_10
MRMHVHTSAVCNTVARFKTESHGGQRDSSFREKGLLLWGGDGTPFAVNRDSFCRQSGLLLPCNVT